MRTSALSVPVWLARQCTICVPIATSPKRRCLSNLADPDVANRLREVMRNVAQPVAIVTARNTSSASKSRYHGATLTSFTSLTLQPDPLVAFSLRLPSRLADCLRPPRPPPTPEAAPDLEAAVAGSAIMSPSPTISPSSEAETEAAGEAGLFRVRLTVSLLSSANETTADALSSRIPDQSEVFSSPEWDESDPPALHRTLGALKCEVVTTIPLRDMCQADSADTVGTAGDPETGRSRTTDGSELFICKVLDVVKGKEGLGGGPLLHLKQRYVGVRDATEAVSE